MDFAIIFVILIGFAGIFLFLNSKFSSQKKDDGAQKIFLEILENLRKEVREGSENSRKELFEITEKSRKETQEKLDKINEQFVKNISENQTTIQRQFSESSKIINSVTEKLTKLDETNKQILSFSEKLSNFENILKNTKERGKLGEYFLETLLTNSFPPGHFALQYKFKNGDLVDAVIFFNEFIIPIDSKFSLEKYNLIQEEKDEERKKILQQEFTKDIKNRIDETSKYIRPSEGTMDFAFMFIPAEGVYYSILNYGEKSKNPNSRNLVEYAFEKKVIITSPSSFFAYIQTVIQGLKMLKFQSEVQETLKGVADLKRHLDTYEIYFQKIGNNLSTTVNMYNSAYKEFEKIDKDVYKLTSGESGGNVKVLEIKKPEN